jgi:ABC-2 type transport system permease protein/sodium transport system permease protein
LGIAPGVCEECFFRGFLYNGLREHLRTQTTIFATAIAFGLFHIVLAGGAAPERILPSTLMGLLLGWVRWRSGSLIPGILLHSLHNATLLAMAKYRDELSGWGLDGVMHQNHLPYSWLGIAAIGFILGFLLILISHRSPTTETIVPLTN